MRQGRLCWRTHGNISSDIATSFGELAAAAAAAMAVVHNGMFVVGRSRSRRGQQQQQQLPHSKYKYILQYEFDSLEVYPRFIPKIHLHRISESRNL